MRKFIKVYATYLEIENYIKSKLPDEYKECSVLVKDVTDNTNDLSVECLCYIVNDKSNIVENAHDVKRQNISNM